MPAREFLELVVRPNVEALLASDADLRLAFNAILAVDALMAHIFHDVGPVQLGMKPKGQDDREYREHLASRQNGEPVRLLRDMAKAHKHVILRPGGSPMLRSSSQIVSEAIGLGQAIWGEFEFDALPRVVVQTNSGEFRQVRVIVKGALALLEAEMARLSL